MNALERLLGMTHPDRRHAILKGEWLGILVGHKDPELQKVLEEVWAPMWDEVGATDAEIETDGYHYPGREIARERTAAHSRSRQDGSA